MAIKEVSQRKRIMQMLEDAQVRSEKNISIDVRFDLSNEPVPFYHVSVYRGSGSGIHRTFQLLFSFSSLTPNSESRVEMFSKHGFKPLSLVSL